MLSFTILLLVPDTHASTFGHDIYTAHVRLADGVDQPTAVHTAIANARDAAMDAYKAWDNGIDPVAAFHVLAVFAGFWKHPAVARHNRAAPGRAAPPSIPNHRANRLHRIPERGSGSRGVTMTSEPYAVTIAVDVFDRLVLSRAAMRRAVADGVSLADYLSMRRSGGDRIAADLIMLLDPGVSPAGCQIQDSAPRRCRRTDWARP